MNITEVQRLQKAYAKAENAYLAAPQDSNAEPVFVKWLRGQADLAKRDYEQAWKIYQGQTTKTAAK